MAEDEIATGGEPLGYAETLATIKAEIAASQARAARSVNTELLALYWRIGKLILDRQAAARWGAKVINKLSVDV